MIVLHDSDGNFGELADSDAFLARIKAGDMNAWQGETGQVGLEHRGPHGSAWLFLSLIANGRYLLYSQRPTGEKIYAVDPGGEPATMHEHILAGRKVEIADVDLVSAAEAIDAARYFIHEDGLLTPLVHWRKDGQTYWPEFD